MISFQIFFPFYVSVHMNQAYIPFVSCKCSFSEALCMDRFSWLDCLWNLHLTFIHNEHLLLAMSTQTPNQIFVAILYKSIDQSHLTSTNTSTITNTTLNRVWCVWIVLLCATLLIPQKASIQHKRGYWRLIHSLYRQEVFMTKL